MNCCPLLGIAIKKAITIIRKIDICLPVVELGTLVPVNRIDMHEDPELDTTIFPVILAFAALHRMLAIFKCHINMVLSATDN
jgi:hypothetical protein